MYIHIWYFQPKQEEEEEEEEEEEDRHHTKTPNMIHPSTSNVLDLSRERSTRQRLSGTVILDLRSHRWCGSRSPG